MHKNGSLLESRVGNGLPKPASLAYWILGEEAESRYGETKEPGLPRLVQSISEAVTWVTPRECDKGKPEAYFLC